MDDMIMKYVVSVSIGVITWCMTKLADKAIAWFAAKSADQNFAHKVKCAYKAWDAVEEFFRINPDMKKDLESTAIKFAEQIKLLLPKKIADNITDDEIKALQQAVAGEVNKGKAVVMKTIS